jgi:hypothetical protein
MSTISNDARQRFRQKLQSIEFADEIVDGLNEFLNRFILVSNEFESNDWNTATYSNVTELTTESIPIGTYIFNCYAICQSTATAVGMGLRMGSGTAVLGATFGKWNITQSANGIGSNFEYDQLSTATNVSSTAASAANTDFLITGTGVVTVTTAGTVAVQIRAENANNVSIRIGSNLFLKRVA